MLRILKSTRTIEATGTLEVMEILEMCRPVEVSGFLNTFVVPKFSIVFEMFKTR